MLLARVRAVHAGDLEAGAAVTLSWPRLASAQGGAVLAEPHGGRPDAVGAGRLAWRHAADPDVQGYVEALLSREQGNVAASDDMLVLDDRIERRNDALALGLLTRW